MKLDLHIHSKYSYDSLLRPDTIIKVAKNKGLDGVAVTDHNTIRGGVEASKVNKDDDFIVIVGSEIKTEYGDVIGLFLTDEIRSWVFTDVVDEILGQGGLTVLAHPFRKGIVFPRDLLGHIDLIEGFNARSTKNLNQKAIKLASDCKIPVTAGSDAHIGFEIGVGRAVTRTLTMTLDDVRCALKNGETRIEGKESSYYLVHGLSVGTEIMVSGCKVLKGALHLAL
ncbi:MAG: PHP domain-containing protein [Methanosarcinales archaeon]|nr:MAG: PHP domain-containing protein [Methanosarcinales archaeon]